MEYSYNDAEFRKEVMKMAKRLGNAIEGYINDTDTPIVAAALSVCVGCFIAAAAEGDEDLERKIDMMLKGIRREAEETYEEASKYNDDRSC